MPRAPQGITMKIYTRTGDDGTTGLFSGGRVPKTHPRVEVYGTVDELNSVLGAARSSGPQPAVGGLLEAVQRQLFKLGADLATPGDNSKVARIDAADAGWLEAEIDRMTAQLPPLSHFILPGGTPAAAQIHVARAISRRCEREALRLEVGGREILVYLNRLSDFLFTLARFENWSSGVSEAEWRA
jgi:cob(I)alamin adenosyltransferase